MGDWRPFVFGGLASVTAESGTFPIDTTKIRLQIQGQDLNKSIIKNVRYRGMIHTAIRITKEESFWKLYSGLKPAILRQATYGTIKIGIYHSLKTLFFNDNNEERLYVNIICGAAAGAISSCIANPTDVLKIRMQSQHKSLISEGLVDSFFYIYKNEGFKGLWRGVGPSANRSAVICAVQLPTYDLVKKEIIKRKLADDDVYTYFISSFIAGLASVIASNPIDVIKTRMMNQQSLIKTVPGPRDSIYCSQFDCAYRTIKHEGFLALYKGVIPNWLRLGPWNLIFFITYERLKKM